MIKIDLCGWLDQQRRVCECPHDEKESEMLLKQMQEKHAEGG